MIPDKLQSRQLKKANVEVHTLCTTIISFSNSTERLLAVTIRLYSGFAYAGRDAEVITLGCDE